MKLHALLALVLLVSACKKEGKAKDEPKPAAKAPDAGAKAPAPVDAAPAGAMIDATAAAPTTAGGAFAIPADAVVLADLSAPDATGLGAEITAHLVTRLAPKKPDGGYRDLDELLVLSGTGSIVVPLGTKMWPDDDGADGTLEAAKPLDPPQPAAAVTEYDDPPPFKGPLIYLWERDRDVFNYRTAVAHDGDAIVVLQYELVDGEGGDWAEVTRIKLSPGAKVVAR